MNPFVTADALYVLRAAGRTYPTHISLRKTCPLKRSGAGRNWG